METMDLTKNDKQMGNDSTGAGSIPDMVILGDTAKENAGAADVALLRSKYEKQDGKIYEIKTSVQEDDVFGLRNMKSNSVSVSSSSCPLVLIS